jgi:hypothetical protein
VPRAERERGPVFLFILSRVYLFHVAHGAQVWGPNYAVIVDSVCHRGCMCVAECAHRTETWGCRPVRESFLPHYAPLFDLHKKSVSAHCIAWRAHCVGKFMTRESILCVLQRERLITLFVARRVIYKWYSSSSVSSTRATFCRVFFGFGFQINSKTLVSFGVKDSRQSMQIRTHLQSITRSSCKIICLKYFLAMAVSKS